MKKIGMIVAISKELESAIAKYGTAPKIVEDSGYTTHIYEFPTYTLYILGSGAGEIYASSSTQYLITKYNVDIIINFGIVGGLTEEMATTKLCVVENVVHYDFDTSAVDNVEVGRYIDYPSVYLPTNKSLLETAITVEPTLTKVICASADKFVADVDKKQALHDIYKADICDMESAGIVLTANRNNIPCVLIKAVADSLFGGAIEYEDALTTAANKCIDITHKIIENI